MKTRILLSAGLVAAANLFGATALHHYTFDGQEVTDSVGSAEGTLLGGAALSDGMLALDGTNGCAQFAAKLVPMQDFSVAFFAQELTPTSDRAEVMSQGYMFGPGFYLGYYGLSRPLRVGDQWQNTGVTFPADGLLHHYAVTTDAAGARLYIDGACVATNTPIHVTSDGYNTRLGQQYEFWGEFFHGNLDELWVFSGALLPAEVARLAKAKSLGPLLNIEVSQVRLCWDSETNVIYQLQYRSEVTGNAWTNLGAPMPGNGQAMCVVDEVTTPRRCYRATALLAPIGVVGDAARR